MVQHPDSFTAGRGVAGAGATPVPIYTGAAAGALCGARAAAGARFSAAASRRSAVAIAGLGWTREPPPPNCRLRSPPSWSVQLGTAGVGQRSGDDQRMVRERSEDGQGTVNFQSFVSFHVCPSSITSIHISLGSVDAACTI